jgi:phage RecT family recombinase
MSESTALQTERYDRVIDLASERFLRTAPKSMSFESEKGFAIQLLETKPELMRAFQENPKSLVQAITNISAIGLSLNPAKGEAYLITRSFKISKNPDVWETRILLEPSYKGLCNLATNTGSILWVQAKHVRAKDTYMNMGIDQSPKHEYSTFGDRGEIVGYYCVAKTHSGDYLTTEMDMKEINKIRDGSESYKKKFGPWIDWPDEQAKKTVIRRAFKTWPKSDQFQQLEEAVNLSNENEGFPAIHTSPPLGQYSAEMKAYFDKLISSSNALEMFVFTKTLNESTYTNLYHSFEKGEKGKYQNIVKELVHKGAMEMRDIADSANDHAEQGFDTAVAELVEGLSKDAIEHLIGLVTPSAASMIRATQA